MIPLFSSTYSIGKSILTLDATSAESDPLGSTSIFSLVKGGDLFLVETTMIGFPTAFKRSKENGVNLRFGLIIKVLMGDSDEEDYNNASKIIVFAKNDQGYQDLLKIYLASQPAPKQFEELKKHITKDVFIAIPFYDSFLSINSLNFSAQIPPFKDVEHVFLVENHGLPFDHILKRNVVDLCSSSGSQMVDTWSIFYENDGDVAAYQTYRCICERATRGKGKKLSLSNPNLNHFGVNNFSWESFCDQQSA